MCLNFPLDFYYEETQIQSMICDLNCQIKNSEESKVVHYEAKSEVLKEEKIELDRESDLAKCKHQIDNFNWMELSWILLILFQPYSLASNVLTLDSKQNHEIIEYVDRKIKSMTNKRHEIEVREKERPIHEKIFGALYERRIGKKVLNQQLSYSIAN